MKAWGVWVWAIGDDRENGNWQYDAEGLLPYVFYHRGPALLLADMLVEQKCCIAMVCEFSEDGTPSFPFLVDDIGDA